MRRHLRLSLPILALLAVSAPPALAEEHSPRNTLGLRVLGGTAFEDHHADGVMGLGLTAERAFLDHHLELELVGAWVRHGGHDAGNGELVLKLPLARWGPVDLFVGAGGVVSVSEHTSLGVLADLGSRVWASDHWGLGLEVDYIRLLGDHDSTAIEGALDVLYRF